MDGVKSMIDRFERIIELKGALTIEQRLRLLDIANKCPLHRTLATPQEFAKRLLEQEIGKSQKVIKKRLMK